MLSFLADKIDERIAASDITQNTDFSIIILAELITRAGEWKAPLVGQSTSLWLRRRVSGKPRARRNAIYYCRRAMTRDRSFKRHVRLLLYVGLDIKSRCNGYSNGCAGARGATAAIKVETIGVVPCHISRCQHEIREILINCSRYNFFVVNKQAWKIIFHNNISRFIIVAGDEMTH